MCQSSIFWDGVFWTSSTVTSMSASFSQGYLRHVTLFFICIEQRTDIYFLSLSYKTICIKVSSPGSRVVTEEITCLSHFCGSVYPHRLSPQHLPCTLCFSQMPRICQFWERAERVSSSCPTVADSCSVVFADLRDAGSPRWPEAFFSSPIRWSMDSWCCECVHSSFYPAVLKQALILPPILPSTLHTPSSIQSDLLYSGNSNSPTSGPRLLTFPWLWMHVGFYGSIYSSCLASFFTPFRFELKPETHTRTHTLLVRLSLTIPVCLRYALFLLCLHAARHQKPHCPLLCI